MSYEPWFYAGLASSFINIQPSNDVKIQDRGSEETNRSKRRKITASKVGGVPFLVSKDVDDGDGEGEGEGDGKGGDEDQDELKDDIGSEQISACKIFQACVGNDSKSNDNQNDIETSDSKSGSQSSLPWPKQQSPRKYIQISLPQSQNQDQSKDQPNDNESGNENNNTTTALSNQILIFQYKSHFHAITHECPHNSYPLSKGTIHDIEDFGIVLSAGITCPRHGWGFDLFTGESERGSYKLELWDVEVREREVVVEDGDENGEDGEGKEVKKEVEDDEDNGNSKEKEKEKAEGKEVKIQKQIVKEVWVRKKRARIG